MMKDELKGLTFLSTVALIFVFMIVIGVIIVTLLSFFTNLIQLSLGWAFLLFSTSWLSVTAIYDRVLADDKKRKMNIYMEAALINFGLAIVSDTRILTWYFYLVGALCFIIWSENVIKGLNERKGKGNPQ